MKKTKRYRIVRGVRGWVTVTPCFWIERLVSYGSVRPVKRWKPVVPNTGDIDRYPGLQNTFPTEVDARTALTVLLLKDQPEIIHDTHNANAPATVEPVEQRVRGILLVDEPDEP